MTEIPRPYAHMQADELADEITVCRECIQKTCDLRLRKQMQAKLPPGVGKRGCANCNGDKEARPRWGNQTASGQNRLGPSPDRWKIRSETYQGIAEAMAEQWGAP